MEQDKFKNRIVGHGTIDPKELQFNPHNPREHSKFQREVMDDTLKSVGWIQDLIINKTTGNVIDGQMRGENAIKNNETEIPVTYVELTEDEEREALLMFDQIGALAHINKTRLSEIINNTVERTKATSALARQIASKSKLRTPKEETEETEQRPTAKTDMLEDKWKDVQVGQLWHLGESSLLVGDSSITENVTRLFHGRKCECIITDPPYGVDFQRGQFITDSHRPKPNKKTKAIENDALTPNEYRTLLAKSFSLFDGFLFSGGAIYCFSAHMNEGYTTLLALQDAKFHIQSQLMWVKSNIVLGQADYQWKHEIVWYGYKEGVAHKWYGARDKSTVFEFPKLANTTHPNEKPVGLISEFIVNSTTPGELVFDPFSGSGTTIIAAQQLGRACYAIEIDPLYAGYALQRFNLETGIEPELES